MFIVRIILNIIKWSLIVVLSALAIYFISTNYNLLGGYRTFVVQSGSMEPFIMTGDIILIKDADKYVFNDIITFTNSFNRIVTHRIIAVDGDEFLTKGDANHAIDGDKIKQEQIIGKVITHVPKLGYYVAFIKTGLGFVLLLLLPVIIFVIDELLKIKDEEEAMD